jgi:hypothetical protein
VSACGIVGCSGCSRCYEALRIEYAQVQALWKRAEEDETERADQAEAELTKIREWLKKEIGDEEFYSGGPRPVERLAVLREVNEIVKEQ